MKTTEFYYTLKIDDEDIPNSIVEKVASEVAEYIIEETIRYARSGVSPVKGHGSFEPLSKDYAENEKGGNRTPDLTGDGSTLNSIDYRVVYNIIKIGYFHSPDSIIADGHNQITAKAKAWARKINFPIRRWVPDRNEVYKSDILKGIEEILRLYRSEEVERATNNVAVRIQTRLKLVGDRRIEESVDSINVLDDDLIRKIIFEES